MKFKLGKWLAAIVIAGSVSSQITNHSYAEVAETTTPFTDVSPEYWGASAIQWAYENHIIDGYSDGSFQPDRAVGQVEFLAMLVRAYNPVGLVASNNWADSYLEYEGKMNWYFTVTPPPFIGHPSMGMDEIHTTRWKAAELITSANGRNYSAKDSIQFLLDKGLANGKTSSSIEGFKMDDDVTRAEAVTLIKNVKSKLDMLYERPFEERIYDPSTLNQSPAEIWKLAVKQDLDPSSNTYSVVSFDSPTKGYEKVSQEKFHLQGKVQKELGDSLMIKIAKQTDRGFVEIQTEKAALDHLVVSQDLALSKGKGLYQIEVYSQAGLNGQKDMQRITMFYVDYE
jgi:hypothetical protein